MTRAEPRRCSSRGSRVWETHQPAGTVACGGHSSSLVEALVRLRRLPEAEAGIARLERSHRSHVDQKSRLGSPRFAVRWRCCAETRPQRSITFQECLERTGTGWLPFRGDVHRFLAEALREAGRGPEAQVVAREALEIYRAKGDIVSAGRVEAFLERSLTPKSSSRLPAVEARHRIVGLALRKGFTERSQSEGSTAACARAMLPGLTFEEG